MLLCAELRLHSNCPIRNIAPFLVTDRDQCPIWTRNQLFCCLHISLTILSYTLGLSQKSITASSHAIEKPIPIHMSTGQKLCQSLEGFTRPSCLCRHQSIPHHTAHFQVYS